MEGTINSWTLTCLGDASGHELALTPAHFLLGKTTSFQIPSLALSQDESVTASEPQSLGSAHKRLLESFWQKRTDHYLKNLPDVVLRFCSRGVLQVRDLVLGKEDHLPRLRWPLGVVKEVFPGKCGLIRTVRLRLAKNIVMRPIQRLHALEVSEMLDALEGTAALPADQGAETHSKHRSLHVSHPPKRLDLSRLGVLQLLHRMVLQVSCTATVFLKYAFSLY